MVFSSDGWGGGGGKSPIIRRFGSSFWITYLGVSKNRGTPKWMVYKGKPYKMDDLGETL